MKETFDAIIDWLNRCDSICRLEFNAKSKVNDALNNVANFRPVPQDKLPFEHEELYSILKRERILD